MSSPQKNFNNAHAARYLVLLSHDHNRRALLFARDHRYLAEVIDDDGLVIDNLVKTGRPCLPPGEVAQQTLKGKHAKLLCFELEC